MVYFLSVVAVSRDNVFNNKLLPLLNTGVAYPPEYSSATKLKLSAFAPDKLTSISKFKSLSRSTFTHFESDVALFIKDNVALSEAEPVVFKNTALSLLLEFNKSSELK